jgi:Fe-S-cluster containining protein
MTVLEAFQWIKLMQELPDSSLVAKLRKFVSFYLTNPARRTRCPFRQDGACTIYPYRTFGCRSYGLWSQKMGRTKTQNSRNSKKALRKMWKNFGVDIPAGIIEYEVDYCDRVQIRSGKPVGDDALMELLTGVYHLGKSLGDLQTRFEDEYHSDFSFLLTSLVFGLRKTLLLKFAVIKETVQKGTDLRLREALGKVSPGVLRF